LTITRKHVSKAPTKVTKKNRSNVKGKGRTEKERKGTATTSKGCLPSGPIISRGSGLVKGGTGEDLGNEEGTEAKSRSSHERRREQNGIK